MWRYTVKSTVHGKWNMKNAVSAYWCQNRLTYVMVLVQIHTLLHFEQFILQKTTYILRLIVLQTLISVIIFTWLVSKICWRRVMRNCFMENFDLVLLKKLTYFVSSSLLYTWLGENLYYVNIFFKQFIAWVIAIKCVVSCVAFTEAATGRVL